MQRIIIEIPDNATPAQVASAALDAWGAKSGGGSDAWRDETGFPKVKLINGAHVMLQAPVNPEWEPSSAAQTFGRAPGTFVADPSSPPGARSRSGYPTVGGFIQFGDGSFRTEEDLAAWRGASAQQGNQGGIDAQQQATLQPGAVDILTLDDADLRFLGAFYNELVPTGLVGPVAIAHRLSHFMDYGASETNKHVAELPNMGEWDAAEAREIKNGKWDSNYRGPLRAVLAKHRGVDDI